MTLKRGKGRMALGRGLSAALSLSMAVTLIPVSNLSAKAEEAPLLKAGSIDATAETKTTGQPFLSGQTGDRANFGAPAFIVKENGAKAGMLVSAADARYDTERRAGGVDIVAAVSEDDGDSWTWSYPMQFADSGVNARANAATINNPVLAEASDGLIYCLANVNPTGVSAMTDEFQMPLQGTGYISVGEGEDARQRLALTDDYGNANRDPADGMPGSYYYDYYVGDWGEDGYAPVLNRENNEASEYFVDRWYNLYTGNGDGYQALTQKQATADGVTAGSTDVQQNVFYAGSDLHVYNTGYVMCVTSEDGKTWSEPEILNPYIKKDDEQALLTASGKGLLTSAGRLVFPVYSRNQDMPDQAGIIWLDINDGGWKRSESIRATDEIGSSSEGEVVEISNGHLRMLFRNDTGAVCYADAIRNAEDVFEFGEPVATGANGNSSANVTAVRYSKTVNGKNAVLAAVPGSATGLANGKIYTFIGKDDEGKSMERSEIFDVPRSASFFGNSCLGLLDGGNKACLLWENTNGGLRYDTFNITDVVKEGYIPDVEIDIRLDIGESYTRTYTVVGDEHLNGVTERPQNEDVITFTFDAGEPENITVPSLYARKASGGSDYGFESWFQTETDSESKIEKAEFLLLQPQNQEENAYSVYNEAYKQYLWHNNPKDSLFSASLQTYQRVHHHQEGNAGAATLNICQIPRTVSGMDERQLLFDKKSFLINGNSRFVEYDENAQYTPEFTFLEKQPEGEAADPDAWVPGYRAVSQITPGRRYLIACGKYDAAGSFADGGVVLLYPKTGSKEPVRLVSGTKTVKKKAQKTLSITACGAGEATIVANDVTYRITCRQKPESGFDLAKGGTRFYDHADIADCSVSDPDVIRMESSKRRQQALFNRTADANDSLSGFSTDPQQEFDLSVAEFRAESSGGNYTFYNQASSKYLMNGGSADTYFGDTAVTHALNREKNENGEYSFEISRSGNGSLEGRYVYFYYRSMKFDAVSEMNDDWKTQGDFGLELLEKKDSVSDSDPIPGYRRAKEIVSGKNYLITEYYTDESLGDGIIVMYPATGVQDQAKLIRTVEIPGVLFTAVGEIGQSATITVGDDTYEVTIADCRHPEEKRVIRGAREADCEHSAYTGDTYCADCNQKLEDGREEGEPLGHRFGAWNMTQEPTAEADGERKRACARCDYEETDVVDRSVYIADLLARRIAVAKGYKESLYTPETYAVLKTARENAEKLDANATNAQKLAAVDAINAAIEGLARVQGENVVTGLKPNEQNASKKNYFSYTAYSGKSWVPSSSEAYIDLGTSDSRAEECFYEVHFEGSGIDIFAVKQPNHGKVKFSIDGGEETVADLYHESKQNPSSVYKKTGLSEGPHVLKAVTLNEKSGNKVVNQVSYAEITHQPYVGGTPDLGGAIVDTDSQWTQNRYEEAVAATKKTAEISAWKNDKALSEIVLYSKDCTLDGVTVTASDLTSAGGTIGAEHVKTTFLQSAKAYNGAYLGYGDKNRPVPPATTANRSESSDILYQQGGAMNIEYDSLLPVWVKFEIPKDAAAGTYTGTLTATAEGIENPLTFTYTVEVKDVELPDSETYKDTFDIELWQYPYSSAEYYDVEPFSEQHLEIMRSSMQIYKDLGGHAITASIIEDAWNAQTYSANDVHYPSMVKWVKSGDSFEYQWDHFDKWVNFCTDMGIGDKIVLYSIAPWHNSFTYWEGDTLTYESYTVGDERYRQVWGDFLEALIAHLEEKGWFDRAYIGIDERGFSAEAFDMIESVTNREGEPLKTAGAMDNIAGAGRKALAMRVDDLNVGDSAAEAHAADFAELLADRQAAGLRTTLYSCTEHKPGNFSLSAPVESYWSMINAAKAKTAGFLRWAYDAWVADPLRDTTHNAFEPGDCFLIYPDEKDAADPASKRSVRIERMAEGVRDVNKLMFLEKEMPSLSSDIESLYNAVTTTAGTGRSYLSAAERASLSTQMAAFKRGLDRLTDNYVRFTTLSEPGLYLLETQKDMKVGQEYEIMAKLVTDQEDKSIVYQSSDPSVVYVDASGKVTANGLGSAQITLKAAGYTAVMSVTVSKKALAIKNTLTDYKLPQQYLSDVEKAPDVSHERHYLGQPDMIMLDDNKTLITVFPVGHGRGKIVMKVSHDAGETWEEKEVPESWLDSFETPTIYKLNMTDGSTKLIVISGRPQSFSAPTGGWDTSISTDGGETWSEFETFQEGPFTDANNTVVAMASLVQLKDDDGNDIDKWMGVYHNGGSFINYKTYLTFDEEGNQQWSDPEPYLSEYRSIEQGHQICEVGMFRSPDEKRIVALARSQSHNHPATMFYSDDEGETWSQPVDLPGSLAGERHKAMYDPTDATGQRMIVTFREIKYDQNNDGQFGGGGDWLAGDWIGWVGTYDQLMNLEEGMYRILLCEDWAANAKSGDTGYTGIVVQPDGTFIMDSYGHWDKEFSESLNPYDVYKDWCWIKQAKFKLSVFDEQAVPDLVLQLQKEIGSAPAESERSKYTEVSFERMKDALAFAQEALGKDKKTQAECYEALHQLRKMKSRLVMKGAQAQEAPVTEIAVTPASLAFHVIGSVQKLRAAVSPKTAADTAVLWKSNDPSVAAVSNKGAVMALKEGSATITATAADGSKIEQSVSVTVKEGDSVSVTGVTVLGGDFELEIGDTKRLAAKVLPENATNQNVAWESGNEEVATVNQDGEVSARKEGSATIKAVTEDGGKEDEVTVTVLAKRSEEEKKEQAKKDMGAALAQAETIDLVADADKYTSETWEPFKKAYEELKGLTEEQIEAMTSDELKEMIKKLTDAQEALAPAGGGSEEETKKEQAKKDMDDALAQAEKIDMKTGAGKYTAATWKPFKEAYDKLKNLTEEQIEAMTSDELNAMVKKLEDARAALKPAGSGTVNAEAQKKEQAKKSAASALANAAKINRATGASKYTEDTWKAFLTAYNALARLTTKQKDSMTAAQLQKLADNLKKAQATLKIAVKVESVKFAQKKYEIVKNKKLNLAKEITSKSPANVTNPALTWKSSNTKVATVTSAGVVKTNKKAAGKKAVISVMNADGTVVGKAQVKVMNGAVYKIKAKGKKTVSAKAGKTVTLKAAVTIKGKKPFNKKLKWSSSNTKVATVTGKLGTTMKVKILKGAKKGKKAKITAKSTDGSNKKFVFTVKVTK